jgi:hypothetical protein
MVTIGTILFTDWRNERTSELDADTRCVEASQPPPKDERMLAVFQERDGQSTRVVMSDGRELIAFNIAWGYDMG